MPLSILYSDRVADLAADLKKRLRERNEAVDDPFDSAPVAVPNRNLENWLRVRAFADEPALAAGVEFPFLDKLLFNVLSENVPADRRPKALLPGDRLRNEIARLLVEGRDPDLAPLRRYVDPAAKPGKPLAPDTDDAARKLWQLSDRLATLSGEYDLRRPDMVAEWLAGGSSGPAGAVERAERSLARALFGEGGRFPAAAGAENPSLRQLFDLVRANPPQGPARTLFFFGQSSLSLLHARILHWLAKTHAVVFYHLTVCLEYWGDIESPWERARQAGATDPGDIGSDNELLSAWGQAGRETMRLLVDLEEENRDVSLDIRALDPAPDVREPTVLSTVQSSVRTRTSELRRVAPDASLQLVKAQSVRREVETVYNAILGAVWRPGEADGGDGPTFSDIAVLVPDMATYRPVIEEVFDGRGQIPYGLVDGAASQDSALLRGLLALFRLAAGGLSRSAIFDVLANPCVQRALRFSPDDLRAWRDRAEETGAFRWFDAADAEAHGLADAANGTWDYALSRLRLSAVAEEAAGADGAPLPLPERADGEDLRFPEIVEELFLSLAPLRDRAALPAVAEFAGDGKDPSCWLEAVERLAARFLAVAPDDKLEAAVRRAVLSTLRSLEGFGALRLPFVAQCIEQFVGAMPSRRGGYLTSGVTVASLQPMRPVPFRQVFVLGLNEGRFPGTVSDSTLDLRGLGRAVGDARMPDINRYLFLETLMAARDRLVLSWVSKDLRKDADLFPCSVVRDLRRFVEENVLPPGSGPLPAADIPLLESDPACTCRPDPVRDGPLAGLLPTYRAEIREAARIRAGLDSPPARFATIRSGGAGGAESGDIRLRDLAEFLADPLKAILSRRFGIERKGWQDKAPADDPALSLSYGPDFWGVQGELASFFLSEPVEPDADALAAKARELFAGLQRRAAAPEGFLGDYERGRSLGNEATLGDWLDALRRTGLRAAGPRTPEPLRVRPSIDVATAGGTRSFRFVGDTPAWYPPAGTETAATALFFRKFDSDAVLAPDVAAGPLLVWLAACADGKAPPPLRVAVVNLNAKQPNERFGAWRWETPQADEARGFLAGLAADWLSFADSDRLDADGHVFSFGWTDFAKAWAWPEKAKGKPAPDAGRFAKTDWPETLKALRSPPSEWDGGGGRTASELAVETLADTLVRDLEDLPEDKLRAIAGKRFAQMIAGIKEKGA